MTSNTLAALEVFQTHRNWLAPWKVAKIGGLTYRQCASALRDLHHLRLIERRGVVGKNPEYRIGTARLPAHG